MQRDVVLRWIEELGRVIRRLLYGPGEVDLVQAAAMMEDATERMLGPLATLVPRLDPPSAADLLSDPHRIFGYAQLLALQSALEHSRGLVERAAETRSRALSLAGEAVRRDPDPPAEWTVWVAVGSELPDG
jgi:hypothetical protein